jgi:hypothetical protein
MERLKEIEQMERLKEREQDGEAERKITRWKR